MESDSIALSNDPDNFSFLKFFRDDPGNAEPSIAPLDFEDEPGLGHSDPPPLVSHSRIKKGVAKAQTSQPKSPKDNLIKNSQKSYSIFEDAEILKQYGHRTKGSSLKRFIDLKQLAPKFGRSLMGIQNRSRLLSKLGQADQQYLVDSAVQNPEESKISFFIWRKNSQNNCDREGKIVIIGVQRFSKGECPQRVQNRVKDGREKRSLECDQIKTMLMSGVIKEDDYFSDSSEISWARIKKRRESEAGLQPRIEAEPSPEEAMQSQTQLQLDEDLIFLKDLVAFLVREKMMSLDMIMRLAGPGMKSQSNLAEVLAEATLGRPTVSDGPVGRTHTTR